MGNKLSICGTDITECVYFPIKIPCEVGGNYSCFICLDNERLVQALRRLNQRSTVVDTNIDKTWIDILDAAKQAGLCLKVFKALSGDDLEAGGFKSEMKRMATLESLNLSEEYTTHRRVFGKFGYTLTLSGGETVRIDGKIIQEVSVMFLEKCTGYNIYNLREIYGKVHATEVMNDIRPLMEQLHRNGLAHGDIKYENMVKCRERFKLIDIGMVSMDTAFKSPTTVAFCAPVFINAWQRHYKKSEDSYDVYNKKYNYRDFVGEYLNLEKLEGNEGVWETLKTNGTVMDICQYNDQYMLAYLLHVIGAIGRESLIIDLLTKPGYFKQSASSGGALKLTRKGTVDILGRTWALYVTTRGKQYIRHKNQWVAVAELRKKKH